MSDTSAAQSTRDYAQGLKDAPPRLYPSGPNSGAFSIPYATKQDSSGRLIPLTLGLMDMVLDEDMRALSTDIEALLPLLTTANADSQTLHQDLLDGNLVQTAVKLALNGVSTRLDALNALITTLNSYNQGILAAQQQQTLSGSNFYQEWTVLAGGQATVPTAQAAVKVMRCVVSASTLLGTLIGGGAKLYVYHCAGANDAYNAAGAVVLGTYPVASNATYAVASGRAVPQGRYLRVQASNGGCAISLDYA